jgi:hypothetical protein
VAWTRAEIPHGYTVAQESHGSGQYLVGYADETAP